jgi:hypothetical protein
LKDLDAMRPTHSARFKGLEEILKKLRFLGQALRRFNEDNGFFLSSGIMMIGWAL